MSFLRKIKSRLWLATHYPADPSLYEQHLEEGGLPTQIFPIGLIDIIFYMDETGKPAVMFRGEDANGDQLDLFTMYGMLDMARGAAEDAAASVDDH